MKNIGIILWLSVLTVFALWHYPIGTPSFINHIHFLWNEQVKCTITIVFSLAAAATVVAMVCFCIGACERHAGEETLKIVVVGISTAMALGLIAALPWCLAFN